MLQREQRSHGAGGRAGDLVSVHPVSRRATFAAVRKHQMHQKAPIESKGLEKPDCEPLSRFPVVAMGVLKWVDWTVSEPRYFQLQTDHTPIHLALLDEVWLHPFSFTNGSGDL